MKTFDCHDAPIRVFGVPFFDETGRIERLPERVSRQLPRCFEEWGLSRRCPGARLRFRTDSRTVSLRVEFEAMRPDAGMALNARAAANLFVGPITNPRYAGALYPADSQTPFLSGAIEKDGVMEDVTVYLPRNEVMTRVGIQLEDGSALEPPTPYRYTRPIVFYGNSVTEGACCSKPANAYSALLSRWLDADYFNLGFSGAARGEPVLADYIHTLPKCMLVMDYDHNAPDPDGLRATHGAFFERVRALDAELPVVMMSASNFEWLPDAAQRRQIVRDTYERARAAGDSNVYFVDGQTLWGDQDRDACSVDRLHPNDLGMYRTALALRPLFERILTRLP